MQTKLILISREKLCSCGLALVIRLKATRKWPAENHRENCGTTRNVFPFLKQFTLICSHLDWFIVSSAFVLIGGSCYVGFQCIARLAKSSFHLFHVCSKFSENVVRFRKNVI